MAYFNGKTVLLTGGGKATLSDGSAGSIGYGIATAFAKEGANLVITGRNMQKLLDAKEELERLYGVRVLPVQADIFAGSDNGATAADVVRQAVEARIATQKNTFEGYGVEQFEMLSNNAVVEIRGNYVLFVVNAASAEAQKAFLNAI